MICQDSRAPSISIELEILWEGVGMGGGGGVQTLSIENLKFNGKFGAL